MYQYSFIIEKQRADASYEGLLYLLIQRLEKGRAARMIRERNSIRFTWGIMLAMSRWDPEWPVNHGEVRLTPDKGRLAYKIGFVRQHATIGAGLIFLLAFMVVMGFSAGTIYFALPLMCLWLFGVSYLIALAYFDRLMKRSIRDAGFSIASGKRTRSND